MLKHFTGRPVGRIRNGLANGANDLPHDRRIFGAQIAGKLLLDRQLDLGAEVPHPAIHMFAWLREPFLLFPSVMGVNFSAPPGYGRELLSSAGDMTSCVAAESGNGCRLPEYPDAHEHLGAVCVRANETDRFVGAAMRAENLLPAPLQTQAARLARRFEQPNVVRKNLGRVWRSVEKKSFKNVL